MATNSLELLAEKGDVFLRTLRAKAAESNGEVRIALERKIAVLKSMVDFSRSVPDDWNQHDRLANTAKGLGITAGKCELIEIHYDDFRRLIAGFPHAEQAVRATIALRHEAQKTLTDDLKKRLKT